MVVVLRTRYQGIYEGGSWAAFDVDSLDDVPDLAWAGDVWACEWWQSPTIPVGVGDNEVEARADLVWARRENEGIRANRWGIGDLVRFAPSVPDQFLPPTRERSGRITHVARVAQFARPLYTVTTRGGVSVEAPAYYLRPRAMDLSESLQQHAQVARRALELLLIPESGPVTQLARGMSSTAWRADCGGDQWVVRVPIADSGRRLSYRAEASVGAALAEAGHPVVCWETVEVDGVPVSVGPFRSGHPIDPDGRWSDSLAAEVAATLAALHGLPCRGWGPLRDIDDQLIGISSDATTAVVDRWFHAAIWPLDGSNLAEHPLAYVAPELAAEVAGRSEAILAAARGRRGLVHSDLHAEHLLVDADDRLAAVLDFGDAFIGSRAWDFALLIHYYGDGNAREVARHYGADDDMMADAHDLAVAVAVYKIAKNPGRQVDVERLTQRLRRV